MFRDSLDVRCIPSPRKCGNLPIFGILRGGPHREQTRLRLQTWYKSGFSRPDKTTSSSPNGYLPVYHSVRKCMDRSSAAAAVRDMSTAVHQSVVLHQHLYYAVPGAVVMECIRRRHYRTVSSVSMFQLQVLYYLYRSCLRCVGRHERTVWYVLTCLFFFLLAHRDGRTDGRTDGQLDSESSNRPIPLHIAATSMKLSKTWSCVKRTHRSPHMMIYKFCVGHRIEKIDIPKHIGRLLR